jgi:hypothetical protein
MGGVEGWLTQRHKFGDNKGVMDGPRARARFALYCESCKKVKRQHRRQ